jgi:hypothetical protein
MLDDKINWTENVKNVSKRLAFNNFKIACARKYFSQPALVKLHKATSIPVMEYGSTVGGGGGWL